MTLWRNSPLARYRCWLKVRREQRACAHHWHPVLFTEWECCFCGKFSPHYYPVDETTLCAGSPRR